MPDLTFGPLTQAETLDRARVEFADGAQQPGRLQFRPQPQQSGSEHRKRTDRQRVLGATINRKTARRRRPLAPKPNSQLAQYSDRRAARVKRVRAEVEMKALLHFRPRPSPDRARFLEQSHVKPGASKLIRGGRPRQPPADNRHI